MGDKYRISVQTRVDDRVQMFHLVYDQTTGPSDVTTAEAAAVAWDTACRTALRNILATNTQYQGVHCTRVFPLPGTSFDFPADDVVGLRTGDAMPALSCMVFNLRNSSGLLKRPGRIFVSGASKSDLEGGVFQSMFRTTQMTAFAAAIKSVAPGGGSSWGGNLVVMRTVDGGVALNPPQFVTVTSIDDSQTPGRQKVRKSQMIGR